MFGKGKGVEKKKPSRVQNTAQRSAHLESPTNQHHQPSIDDSDADDCSSQYIEDISEPTSIGPIYVKGRDAETPNVGLPSRESWCLTF